MSTAIKQSSMDTKSDLKIKELKTNYVHTSSPPTSSSPSRKNTPTQSVMSSETSSSLSELDLATKVPNLSSESTINLDKSSSIPSEFLYSTIQESKSNSTNTNLDKININEEEKLTSLKDLKTTASLYNSSPLFPANNSTASLQSLDITDERNEMVAKTVERIQRGSAKNIDYSLESNDGVVPALGAKSSFVYSKLANSLKFPNLQKSGSSSSLKNAATKSERSSTNSITRGLSRSPSSSSTHSSHSITPALAAVGREAQARVNMLKYKVKRSTSRSRSKERKTPPNDSLNSASDINYIDTNIKSPSLNNISELKSSKLLSASSLDTSQAINTTPYSSSPNKILSPTQPLPSADDVHSSLIDMAMATKTIRENYDFHKMFPIVPIDERLVEDYACALNRDGLLVQGRMWISEHHLCFKGWAANSLICCGFGEIIRIDKRNVALLIPNSIGIETLHSKYFFASYLARDATYDLLISLWNQHQPTNEMVLKKRALKNPDRFPHVDISELEDSKIAAGTDDKKDDDQENTLDYSDSKELSYEGLIVGNSNHGTDLQMIIDESNDSSIDFESRGRSTSVNFSKNSSNNSLSNISDASSSYTHHKKKSSSSDRYRGQIPTSSLGIPTAGVARPGRIGGHSRKKSAQIRRREKQLAANLTRQLDSDEILKLKIVTSSGIPIRNWTETDNGKLTNIASIELKIELEQLWTLIYSNHPYDVSEGIHDTSNKTSFSDNFLQSKIEATNLVRGPWKAKGESSEPMVAAPYPVENGGYDVPVSDIVAGLHRDIQYSMPLNAPIGPKNVSCKQSETVLWANPNEICMETEARTPDAPSGGSFYVVTRAYFQRMTHGSTKLEVCTHAVFTKSCWIKMAIEKGSLEGQRGHFNKFLDSIEKWINSNTQFVQDYVRSAALGSGILGKNGTPIPEDIESGRIGRKPEPIAYAPPISNENDSFNDTVLLSRQSQSLNRLSSKKSSAPAELSLEDNNEMGGESMRRIKTLDERQNSSNLPSFFRSLFGKKGGQDDLSMSRTSTGSRTPSPGTLASLKIRSSTPSFFGNNNLENKLRQRNISGPLSAVPMGREFDGARSSTSSAGYNRIKEPDSFFPEMSKSSKLIEKENQTVVVGAYRGIDKINSIQTLLDVAFDVIQGQSQIGLSTLILSLILVIITFVCFLQMGLIWRLTSNIKILEQNQRSLINNLGEITKILAEAKFR